MNNPATNPWIRGLIVLAVVSVLSGCTAVPVGSRVLGTEEVIDEEPVLSEATLEADLVEEEEEPVLRVRTVGTFTRGARHLERTAHKKVVLGFFPAIGIQRYGQRETNFMQLTDPVQNAFGVVAMPVIGWGVGLVCTPVSWFHEFTQPWDDGDQASEPVACSVFGWGKTTDIEERFTPIPGRQTTEERPFEGAVVTLREPNSGLETSREIYFTTGARFRLAELPLIQPAATDLEISVSGIDVPVEGVRKRIPAHTLGSALGQALWDDLEGYPRRKIYTAKGPVDFSPGRPEPIPTGNITARAKTTAQNGLARVKVTVANKGEATLYRLIARTFCSRRDMEERLLVFGRIGPGQKRTRTLEFPLDEDGAEGRCRVDIRFRELHRHQPGPLALVLDYGARTAEVLTASAGGRGQNAGLVRDVSFR